MSPTSSIIIVGFFPPGNGKMYPKEKLILVFCQARWCNSRAGFMCLSQISLIGPMKPLISAALPRSLGGPVARIYMDSFVR